MPTNIQPIDADDKIFLQSLCVNKQHWIIPPRKSTLFILQYITWQPLQHLSQHYGLVSQTTHVYWVSIDFYFVLFLFYQQVVTIKKAL